MAKPVDVIAVRLIDSKILWVIGNQNAKNAEAQIKFAIMRQGVEDRFFITVEVGTYQTGDKYVGY